MRLDQIARERKRKGIILGVKQTGKAKREVSKSRKRVSKQSMNQMEGMAGGCQKSY
uniref:Uncharacterized protein n=1 Tax=Rhizophora mucronata TaxID=61149 RepID=A0A2P2J3D5_RHIMU